jgi:hypothetical protein
MGWMRVGGLPVEDREAPPHPAAGLGGLPRAFLQAGFHRDVRRIMLSDPLSNSSVAPIQPLSTAASSARGARAHLPLRQRQKMACMVRHECVRPAMKP